MQDTIPGGDELSQHFSKTDAGREEIRNRSHKLPRPTRNLLLIIDDTRTASEWMLAVQGATDSDVHYLLAAGLIEPVYVPDPASKAEPRGMTLEEALARFEYKQLYTWMTGQSRAHLGLIKGFQMVLEIEKCSGVDELRALMPRMLQLVEQRNGADEARKLRVALGMRG